MSVINCNCTWVRVNPNYILVSNWVTGSWEHCKTGSAQWGSEGEIKWVSFVINSCWQPEVLHISGLKLHLCLDDDSVQSIERRSKFGVYKENTQRASHSSIWEIWNWVIWKLLFFQLMTDFSQSQKAFS